MLLAHLVELKETNVSKEKFFVIPLENRSFLK